MSDLNELYQQLIIDHGRSPRNFAVSLNANHVREGHNPLCGDQLTIYITEKNNVVENATFQGCGCAISMASASLMTEALKGKSVERVKKIFQAFHELITIGHTDEDVGKLTVLAGVNEFPMRVKCATLAWHTMMAAIENNVDKVSTE